MHKVTGFMELFIAFGIVAMLAVSASVLNFFGSQQNRHVTERVNRSEAFYSNELLAWHGYLRNTEALVASKDQYVAVSFNPMYVTSVIDSADAYSTAPGQPLNVSATRQLSPAPSVIRRFASDRFATNVDSANVSCGRVGFTGKKNYRVCLGQFTPPTPTALFYLGVPKMEFTGTGVSVSFIVHRYLSNGESVLTLPAANPMAPISILVRPDHKIMGFFEYGASVLNADGTFDSTFAQNGVLKVSLGPDIYLRQSIFDSHSLPALFTYNESRVYQYLSRYRPDGSLDTQFGNQGNSTGCTGMGVGTRILQTPNGIWSLLSYAIIQSGHPVSYARVCHLNLDGTPDLALGPAGMVDLPYTAFALLTARVRNNGDLDWYGYDVDDSYGPMYIGGYLATGQPNPVYGAEGRIKLNLPPGNTRNRYSAQFSDDDSIYASWQDDALMATGATTTLKVGKFHLDGTPDTSFGTQGVATWGGTQLNVQQSANGNGFTLLGDGSFLIFHQGLSSLFPGGGVEVARFLRTGQLDTQFGKNGSIATSVFVSSLTPSIAAIPKP